MYDAKRLYVAIEKRDAAARKVSGYASTEALDSEGETVTRDALEKALAPFMRFANVREMHRPSAVGVVEDAEVDNFGLYVDVKVTDPLAWEKVVAKVYKGFSIGGRVTERDPDDSSRITGLDLAEISLVDRPANPEAVFDVVKVAAGLPERPPASLDLVAKLDALTAECRRLQDRVTDLESQPEDGPRLRKAVSKEADGGGSDAPPKDALDAILKSHRNPIRF